MTRYNIDTIREKTRGFFQAKIDSRFGTEVMTFDDDTDLYASGLIDSLHVAGLISLLENEFQIKVNEDDMIIEKFCSVEKTALYVTGYFRAWGDR